jgi:hypothetical protein
MSIRVAPIVPRVPVGARTDIGSVGVQVDADEFVCWGEHHDLTDIAGPGSLDRRVSPGCTRRVTVHRSPTELGAPTPAGDTIFAGDLLLSLATEGRLRVDPCVAERTIAGLERTLDLVHARLRMLGATRRSDLRDSRRPSQAYVNAHFAEQLAPTRLHWAAIELPKYIEALRQIRNAGEDRSPT